MQIERMPKTNVEIIADIKETVEYIENAETNNGHPVGPQKYLISENTLGSF